MFRPRIPAKAAALLPDAKILAILRNPVDRAYSHYQHVKASKQEPETFERGLELEPERILQGGPHIPRHSYVARGQYADQLDQWAEHYDRGQILVLQAEALFEDGAATMAQVWDHLGLDEFSEAHYPQYNRLAYQPMAKKTHQRLTDHFRPYNERLYRDWVGWRW